MNKSFTINLLKECRILYLILGLICYTSCSGGGGTDSPSPPKEEQKPQDPEEITNSQNLNKGLFFPKGKQLASLCVINGNGLSEADRVLVATLQGLAAKTSSEQIFIEEGGATTTWKKYLNSRYGVTLKDFTSAYELLAYFKKSINIEGYVLYNRTSNPRSLTVASGLCGPLNAIAVDKHQKNMVVSSGVNKCIMDVSDRDEKWAYNKYPNAYNKQFAAELSQVLNHHLRDYVSLTNCFVFYDGDAPSAWRTEVLQGVQREGYLIGGGPDEFGRISNNSEQGVPMIGADMASNLSTLSSIYSTTGLKQIANSDDVTTEADVHYVSFMFTDGDNVAYDLWTMHDVFSDPLRGTIPVGYTISPWLYDLAPSVLRWYYENKTQNDYFICGPSGCGYVYPTMLSAGDHTTDFIDNCNEIAGATGLNMINVIDYGGVNNMPLWNKFLAQPNIDAIIYTGYAEDSNGSIKFSDNDKPVIEAGDLLWGGLAGEENGLITRTNAKPTDPTKTAGYTLVVVHVWSKGYSDIKKVVDGFNSKVRVVTPEKFVKLVKKNLAPNA